MFSPNQSLGSILTECWNRGPDLKVGEDGDTYAEKCPKNMGKIQIHSNLGISLRAYETVHTTIHVDKD